MSRLKTFLIYALIVIGFYFLSNVLIFFSIKGTYKNIGGQIMTQTPSIEVTESKATYINGYVNGKITNNTSEKIENKYLKIDVFSERNVNLGTKYVKIDSLDVNQAQEFHMGYRLKDSESYEISFVEEATGATDDQFISDETTGFLLLCGLIVLCIM